jgi:transposase
MAGKLPMGQKELIRAKVIEQVVQKQLSLQEAAVKIKVSYRQAKRIYQRYLQEGDQGLVHRRQGKASGEAYDSGIREAALRVYQERYGDFGPTFAAEKLKECHGIIIDHETLRRWLIAAGLWERKRRRKAYRSRRQRRECCGELLQFDGSHHDWFEGRRSPWCLMNMVDDATGLTFSFFCEEETTSDAMRLLWRWIERYGLPQALYCDKKNAFVLTREPTIEEANHYLVQTYLPNINDKFAKEPQRSEDAHVPLITPTSLDDIFSYETPRVVSNDYVVSYQRRLFQITRTGRVLPTPKTRVIVRELLDGRIKLLYQTTELEYVELEKIPHKEELATRSA